MVSRPQSAPTAAPARLETVRIIVADDSAVARHSISEYLRTLDPIEVVAVCANGRAALEIALRESPRAVLLDLQMPEMSGLEAAAVFRSCLPETAVIIMTVHDHPEVQAACLAGGADAFVPKARLVRQFEGALAAALAAAGRRSTPFSVNPPDTTSAPFPSSSAARSCTWKSPAEAAGAKDANPGSALPRNASAPSPRRAT